jgi:transcription-repair coupling factor (superfamily II helicase)
VHLRLILYKRVAGAESRDALRELQVELIDRFGLLPQAAKNYLRLAALKRDAIALGIEKIDAADNGGYVLFGEETKTDPLAIVGLVQKDGSIYRLSGAHRLQFRLDLSDIDERFSHVEKLLDTLAGKAVQSVEAAC